MTPYYADDWLTLHLGDCRAVMAAMEPESVHCVVTSPPYWGLRDYGTTTWVGGDEACDHKRPNARMAHERRASTLGGGVATVAAQDAGVNAEAVCGRCGAQRIDSQLGLETTPESYVESMVAVFREVRRVLRSDGTVWLNLGDSYANDGKWGGETGGKQSYLSDNDRKRVGREKRLTGLKPKDLVGIPWRVAFALQADGWYLRSDIIWAKPNPMPESVTDRPTKSHEYLFLLSKSPRYYFDADAVREPHQHPEVTHISTRKSAGAEAAFLGNAPTNLGRTGNHPAGRNIRSVWTIATQPYPGAHFATFPQALVEPCIKAGTSERGVCPECGAPWERIVERPVAPPEVFTDTAKPQDGFVTGYHVGGVIRGAGQKLQNWRDANPPETTGWRPPSCGHHDKYTGLHERPVRPVVLDPFAGSGTTGLVAQRLSRRAVLIDLNADYLEQVMDRNRDIPLGLGA